MAAASSYLAPFLSASASPFLQFFAIVLATFVLEDAASVLSAMAAADGQISVPVALGSLFVGITLGDLGLFAVGRFAASHPWAQRWVGTDRMRSVQAWMDDRLFATVISSRFVPGARLPTYTACGFLGMSFARFAVAVVLGTLVWTTLLFVVALSAGSIIMTYLGPWRWPVGIVVAVLIIWAGHWLARRRRKNRGDPE